MFSEDSHYICPHNMYIVLSVCLLFGLLDRFSDFYVFMIFSTPVQDGGLKFSEINQIYILHIFTKFYQYLFINWGAWSIPKFLSFKGCVIFKDVLISVFYQVLCLLYDTALYIFFSWYPFIFVEICYLWMLPSLIF